MREFNNYGYRTLNCRQCGQQIAYGHKDASKDQERRIEPEEMERKE